jgi:hypothetical protein
MNRPLWKWLLAISLSLNLGFIGAVAFNRFGPASKTVTVPRPGLTDRLQLDTAQRARWEQAEHGFLKDLSANWREIRVQREALVREIFSSAPDRSTIDAQQARIAALQDAQQRRVIAQLLAERELLDARQREALMHLLLTQYAQEATEEELLHRE